MRFLRTGFVLLALLVTGGLWTSCNTPTLPIPPPINFSLTCAVPSSCFDPLGVVTVTGETSTCPDRIPFLMVFNTATMEGVYSARLPDLTFEVRIPAAVGDSLYLMCMASEYEVGLKTTPQIVTACATP
jgi:hypothetical protein